MQRLSLMRIMKRQRMKYEEFESIYPVTIYHKQYHGFTIRVIFCRFVTELLKKF